MKDFLKLSWLKAIITGALLILAFPLSLHPFRSIIFSFFKGCSNACCWGYPLVDCICNGTPGQTITCALIPGYSLLINIIVLILHLLISYLLVSLILKIVKKIRK